MKTGFNVTLNPAQRENVIARIAKATTPNELKAVKATLTDNEKTDIDVQVQISGQLRIVAPNGIWGVVDVTKNN